MKTLALIVTYNPERELLRKNIEALLPQVAGLLVIDNASGNRAEIRELAGRAEYTGRIRLIENPKNTGLPVNYNRAARIAEQEGAEWLLIMDQDTVVPPDLIEKYQNHTGREEVALISPVILDRNNPGAKARLQALPKEDCTVVERCISSASLNRVRTIRELGGFDEKLFIDWVDYDYCYNVRAHGYQILRVNGAVVDHRLGDGQARKIPVLGRNILVRPNAPIRVYYVNRNQIYVRRKYKGVVEIPAKGNGAPSLLIKGIIRAFFYDRKLLRCKMVIRGVRDGLRMKVEPQTFPDRSDAD